MLENTEQKTKIKTDRKFTN